MHFVLATGKRRRCRSRRLMGCGFEPNRVYRSVESCKTVCPTELPLLHSVTL